MKAPSRESQEFVVGRREKDDVEQPSERRIWNYVEAYEPITRHAEAKVSEVAVSGDQLHELAVTLMLGFAAIALGIVVIFLVQDSPAPGKEIDDVFAAISFGIVLGTLWSRLRHSR